MAHVRRNNKIENIDQQYFNAGKHLVNVTLSEEICITGIAGCFPKCDDVSEYFDSLSKKMDLLSDVSKSWKVVHPNIPSRIGKVNNLEKFDSGFFGVHYHQAEAMDPGCRKLLELSLEAVIDAGINPTDIRGTNTGVFIASQIQESEKEWLFDNLSSPNFGITGCPRATLAHRISYHLGLQGPSVGFEVACNGSIYALENAFRAIRTGRCDNALVGGVNLLLNCNMEMEFFSLGVLDKIGKSSIFDEEANGYVRAEAVSIIFLQKMKDAKRVYAKIVHVKTNCDGFKEENIAYPSREMQENLFREVYDEAGIVPVQVNYIEAHSTGTKAGMTEEIAALENVFCTNRKKSLLIGSVKSNIGHSEASSGLCSITKVILGMVNECVLPSINCKNLRKDIDAFHNGKIAVVSDIIPADVSEYIGVNNSGIGGTNGHVLLKQHKRPISDSTLEFDNRTQLICVSGRTSESLNKILNSIDINCQNEEYISFLQGIFKNDIMGHFYRGYTLLSNSTIVHQSFRHFSGTKPRLTIIFSEYSAELMQTCATFCEIPLCLNIIQNINNVATKQGIDILQIIRSKVPVNEGLVLIGSVVFQITLVVTLKFLEIPIIGVVGYSSGLISSAYASNSITLEDAILTAFQLSQIVQKKSKHSAESSMCYSNIDYSSFTKSSTCLQIIVEQIPSSSNDITPKESAEYLLNNILSSNSLDKLIGNVTEEDVTLTIGLGTPNLCPARNIGINVNESLLSMLGLLYEHGFNPNLEKLSQKLLWPVKVPSISPLIKWNHDEDWFVHDYKSKLPCGTAIYNISSDNSSASWNFLMGHNIDGRILFPATGYIYIVWETFLKMLGCLLSEAKVVFENVKFLRTAIISQQTTLQLTVNISKISKKFEVRDPDFLLVKGEIYSVKKADRFVQQPTDFVTERVIAKKNIYKILHLRNYNFDGAFCGLEEINLTGSTCAINRWEGNWVTFMDSMLHIRLIQEDAPNIQLPIGIEYLIVDPHIHLEDMTKLNEKARVQSYKHGNIIHSSGVEIRNILWSATLAKNVTTPPVLETYKFFPCTGMFPRKLIVRINIQIILENIKGCNFRMTEILDQYAEKNEDLLSPVIYEILLDEPFVQSEIGVFSSKKLSHANITFENKNIDALHHNCNLVVISRVLHRSHVLSQMVNKLHDHAFILSREHINTSSDFLTKLYKLEIITVYQTKNEELVLLRKVAECVQPKIISVNSLDNDFKWLPVLQNATSTNDKVLLLAENQPLSGILGFVNCLIREPAGESVSCLFIMDDERKFNENDDLYANQIRKGLTKNVLKNGEWGTYRHLPLHEQYVEKCKHAVGTVVKGNMSSFHWLQGPLDKDDVSISKQNVAQVYYVGLNFRDVIAASGTINLNSEIESKEVENYAMGLEFAGRNFGDERVMGMVRGAALSNLVVIDPTITWAIPSEWSMEDAATIPVVYSTVLYGLITVARIKQHQTILIHAGAGGVGQAAINVALYFNCNIFTTVGSSEKRIFIKALYPTLKDSHIGNSRDTSFEHIVLKETRGRGVDLIINSLAKEKLCTGLRCLAPGGKFIEIGKYDAYNNNSIEYSVFSNGRSFSAIHLDTIFDIDDSIKVTLTDLLSQGIKFGYVQPLSRTVYSQNKVEDALRWMADGKHIGKVLIKLKIEETESMPISSPSLLKAKSKFYCNSKKVYVIVGGLGGFGLELTDWLIVRGAKKVVLVSRRNIATDYQSFKINKWKCKGTKVYLSQKDLSTQNGCVELIMEATRMGHIDGIFNLAAILKDGLLENQTPECFIELLLAKAVITANLDIVSRKMCPDLRQFVTFSSLSCGRGNAGQTNYGMANSAMERICENRRKDGYPSLVIQWGPVAEVGMLADMEASKTIAGTLQQKISSCLKVMDVFLTQQEVIVSSMVVAEKSSTTSSTVDIVKDVSNILGMTKVEHVNLHSTLAELGMNSISSVELKQFLESHFQYSINPRVLRNMTLFKLKEKHDELRQ